MLRSKLFLNERKESSKCGNSRCQACTSIQITDTFPSFDTKSACKINQNFNCKSKCLIHLLS